MTGAPRVALCFITRGELPHERAWQSFLASAAYLTPPAFSGFELSSILEERKLELVTDELKAAGQYTPTQLLQLQPCVQDSAIRVC